MTDDATPPPSPAFLLLGWFPEFLRLGHQRLRRQSTLLGAAVVVGLAAGLGAIAFYVATRFVADFALGGVAGYQPPFHPDGEPVLPWWTAGSPPFSPWLLLAVPTLGGLLSGFLVVTFAPEAEGHGTDSVISAYHHRDGYIRPRVPWIKMIASALTIGTGGSGGREGPIAQIGAGFGSMLSRLLRFRAADCRILTAAGMGAGVAAIFRAPLAGALFAAEVLYRSPEFEPEVIIPAGIASAVSYCTFSAAFGWEPLFRTPNLTFTDPRQLGPYFLLAVFMIFLAALYVRTFYGVTGLFRRWRISRSLKPAVGAFLTGGIGLAVYALAGRDGMALSVLSFGYGAIQQAMTDSGAAGAGAGILLLIAFGKILTTSLTIGSGGSGGVFGPSMVIGGCGGGALGLLLHRLWPALVPHPASFVIVGMAGFFAAAAKTPFSTLVIVSEMTGGYHLLLPTLWVSVLAYMLSDERSIYDSQVESRALSPAHQGRFVREILAGVRVGQFMKKAAAAPSLRPEDPLDVVIRRFQDSTLPLLPVVDADQRLLGVIDLNEVHRAHLADPPLSLIRAVDLLLTDVIPLTPDDPLDRAMERFASNEILALPVVNNPEERKLLGVVRRTDLAAAYLGRLHAKRREETKVRSI